MEYLGEQVAKLADIHDPEVFPVDDSMIIPTLSEEKAKKAEVVRGPNIQPMPVPQPPTQYIKVPVSLKAADNITTDDITPASAPHVNMQRSIRCTWACGPLLQKALPASTREI